MLKPLGDRVIIEVTEAAEETVGGILLATNAKEKPVTGDEVLFDKYAGQEVSFEGNDYLALHEKDIVAIVA